MKAAAHDLSKTRDCKVGGCTWDAEDARGRYAGLCRDHKRDAIAAGATERRAAKAARRSAGRTADGRIIAAAQQVLAASRSLERAIDGVYKAEQRRNEATVVFRARVATLISTAVRELEQLG